RDFSQELLQLLRGFRGKFGTIRSRINLPDKLENEPQRCGAIQVVIQGLVERPSCSAGKLRENVIGPRARRDLQPARAIPQAVQVGARPGDSLQGEIDRLAIML